MFLTLLYHIIDPRIRAPIAIGPHAFSQQLDWLKSQGYEFLSIADAHELARNDGTQPPKHSKSVLLTFDDAYVSVAETALPIIEKYRARATVFVCSAFIGMSNRWNPSACYDTNHMSWADLVAWSRHGGDLGGHSQGHLCMSRLRGQELHDSLVEDTRTLQDKLGITPIAFSYPYGVFTPRILSTVSQYYDIAFSVDDGTWLPTLNRFAINRLSVSPALSISLFASQVESRMEGIYNMTKASDE